MTTKKRLTNADFLYGLVSLLVCLACIILSSQFPPGTSDGVPGCGVFPTLISILTMVLSIILMIKSFLNPVMFMNFMEMPRVNKIALIGTAVALGLSFVIWYFIHYIVSSIFLMTALGILFKMDWKKSFVFGVFFSAGTYYIFGKLLMVMLNLR